MDFGHLLQKSIDRQQLCDGAYISPSKQSHISKWILEVWKYLATHDDIMESVEHLNILPEASVDNNSSVIQLLSLKGIYMIERQGSSVLPESVCEVLRSLGVTILQAHPGYLPCTAIERYLFSPTIGGVCEILAKLLASMTSPHCFVEKFEKLPECKRKEFAVFMSQARKLTPIVATFLKSIKMFPSTKDKNTECICSLSEVRKLAPLNDDDYPIGFPYPLIPGDFKGARLVLELGFHQQTDEELTKDILCAIKNREYSVKDVDAFMTHFLYKIHTNVTPEQIEIASSIPFVLSTDGKRRPPRELFGPTEEVRELFYGETDRFPEDIAFAKLHANGLHTLGLKSEKDVLIRDLMQTLDFLTREKLNSLNQTRIKIRTLEKYINGLSSGERQQLLEKMKSSRWMLKMTTKPKHYPQMMTWCSANDNLEIPDDLYHSEYNMLVGSVAMVAESNLSSDILDYLLHKPPSIDVVLNQLLLLSGKYETAANHSEFLQMLQNIYHYIAKETESGFEVELQEEEKLVWTGKVFVKPRQVFINSPNEATEIALEPFMYKLPEEYSDNSMLKSFFLKLGCKAEIEAKDLIFILNCIKDHQMSSTLVESKHNLSVVVRILDILEEMKQINRLHEEDMSGILFPVQSHNNNFQLFPVTECTYVDYKRDIEEEDEDEDLKYVHPKIRASVAAILGVPSLTRRIVESEGVEDIPWGQKEELTDRLKNLIEDYADGTSVLKEMLQNADDAGASCLRILYDERTNENALTGLIDKGMTECQGPAIWVYNDAKFDEKDFENIIKLGAGTKEADLTKIGKFGLGFCSVYNITDMPSILSGGSLVILDPRTIHLGKALKNSNPGLRFKISDSKTRYRLRHQLRPFNGIFTCDFQNERDWMSYEGTLFRLPLRTAKDADETKHQISPKHYTEEDVILLIKKFIQDAGNLMLFIQSVNTIEFYHYPREATEACRFYKIQRNSKIPNANMLKKANEGLLKQNSEMIQVREDITITVDIFKNKLVEKMFQTGELKVNSSETKWTICWQIGSQNQYPYKDSLKRHVVVGSTAIPIKHCLLIDRTEKKCSDIPLGFYRTGHIFCFLPLPQESFIPVHVNGYFAVESSRRRLTTNHSDNVYSEGAEWNKFILRNPICLSFLNLLENLSVTIPKEKYYEKWPILGIDEMINELVISFYERLLMSEHRLFYGDGLSGDANTYHFKECIFLDPSLRYGLGQNIGKKAFNCFLKFNANGAVKHAMDLPECIYKQFQEIPACNAKLKENICNEKTFFLFSFIPSLATNWWCNSMEERNILLLHVLQCEDEGVKAKLKETPCIPTKPNGKLRKPGELIFPDPFSSGFCVFRLFDIEDERFPSEEFMKSNIIKILMEFGMMSENLSNELVIDRAKSVQRLSSKPEKMKDRCDNVLRYLEMKMQSHAQIKKSMQDIKFLPVLQKPETSHWPFKWYSAESKKLESGKKLFLTKCRNIVGCVQPVVDLDEHFDRVLEYLGLRGFGEVEEKTVIDNLEAITTNVSDGTSEKVWNILEDVYKYLHENNCRLLSSFKDKQCLLTKSAGLVKPEICAIELQTNIEPFLYKVEDRWKKYTNFLHNIGVKQNFSIHCLVQTIVMIDPKEGESSNHVPSIVRLFNMLSKPTRRSKFQSECDLKTMLLPDENGVMRKPTDLCIDDKKSRIAKDNKILFVHGDLNTWTTSLFEIKSKSAQFIKRYAGAISFGQSEKLVTRLKGILRDYPCNISILNELLQNADDAGATEIHFIHDQRTHPKESLFDKSLEHTQGPSLVVFNNSCFSEKDIEGISKLGEGSKGSDPMTTGQFGIGFNAVYHMTDVPSFLTIGEKVPNGGALVMFDPHCKYVPLATPQNPGMILENIQIIKETYPDMYHAYLTEEVPSSTGTWFRFPLRTDIMAQHSEIKRGKPMGNDDLIELFSLLREDMPKSLMFLSKIDKITLSVIPEDGEIQQIASVSARRNQTDQNKLQKFNSDIKQYIHALRAGEVIEPLSVQYQLNLDVSCNESNDHELWCVSQVCGVQASAEVSQRLIDAYKNEEISLSPRAGVAYKVVEEPDTQSSQAFNFLPLPVTTKLPVHINGHFAVDAARTNIWQDVGYETLKGFWNNFLLEYVLPFAYTELVCFLRGYLFKKDAENVLETVKIYNNAFPILSSVSKTKWARLVKGFYQTTWEKKMEIFPIYLPVEVYNTLKGTRHFLTKETQSIVTGECISFVSLNNDDHRFLAYFMPLTTTRGHIHLTRQQHDEMSSLDTELPSILKLLGMKILTSSTDIANSVQKTLQPHKRAPFLTVGDIVMFLKSWNTEAVDKCRITTVGVSIEKTLFRDIKPIQQLLSVCFDSTIHNQLEGIPLCVRNDNILEVFSKDKKKLFSNYSDLLPESSEQFLHKELNHIFEKQLSIVSDFLSPLSLETFSKLLGKTLSSRLHAEIPVPLSEKHQDRKWFCRFWEYLSFLSGKDVARDCEKHLGSWCLIPAAAKSSKRVVLFPFKLRYAVLETASFLENPPPLSEDPKIGKILTNLDIPSPWKTYIGDSFPLRKLVQRVCASSFSPENVLSCLIHHKVRSAISLKDAELLLMYLFRKLYDSFSTLRDKFREVILYESIDGVLTNLRTEGEIVCMERGSIPTAGLQTLCKHYSLKILKKNSLLYELHNAFAVKEMNAISFYKDYFLSNPQLFDLETRMIHIEYIKQKNLFDSSMQHLIRNFPFIQNTETRRLQRVCEFLTPFSRLCRQMCTKRELLPLDPFYKEDWKEFLVYAGLKIQIPVDVLLRFAKEIDERQSRGIDESLVSHSKLLLAEIMNVPDLHKEQHFLRELRQIKCLIPGKVEKEYAQIVGHFITGQRLISFENAVYPESKLMIWSSCKILPNLKHPNILESSWKVVEELLLIQKTPPLKDVISHIHKLCYMLEKMVRSEDQNRKLQNIKGGLHFFMETLYSDLEGLAPNSNDIAKLKKGFCETPLIYNKEHNRFLRLDQVALEQKRDEEIPPYLCRGSEIFGKHYEFFRKLGVADEACIHHYVRVFDLLHTSVGNRTLFPQELEICKKTMTGFLCSLEKLSNTSVPEDEKYAKLLEFPCIYLPTDVGGSVMLVKSSNLTIRDTPHFGNRMGNFDLIKFIKSVKNDIHHENRLLSRLPGDFRPMLLSQQVKEVLHSVDTCECSGLVETLNRKFQKADFVKGICDILSKSADFTGAIREQCEENLRRLRIQQVSNLETKLVFRKENMEISGSLRPQTIFYESDESVVYMNILQNSRSTWRYIRDQLFEILVKITNGIAIQHRDILLKVIESESDEEMKLVLSTLGVNCESIWEPNLGSYVPADLHDYLDNSIRELHPGEIVAYEVLNPLQDDVSDYVFIYVRIIKKRDNRMFPMYDINDGSGIHCEIAFRLYRFVHSDESNTSTEIERYTDLQGEVYQSRKGVIFEEIKLTLIEAWKYDLSDFQRVRFRLLMNWHPDKHSNNPLATEVTQYINEIVRRLKNGEFEEFLRSNSDDSTERRSYYYRNRKRRQRDHYNGEQHSAHAQPQRTNYDDWLHGYMNRRRSRRRGNWTTWGRGQEKLPNPQPDVGKLWLKQAKYDINTALQLRRCVTSQASVDEGDVHTLKWVCYMCHKVRFIY